MSYLTEINMFTKEQVKKLIESTNVGNMSESEMDVLVQDTMERLNESFSEQYEKGKADGMREANEGIRKIRLESFQRGQEKGMSTVTEAVEKAEDAAFKAGRERGIAESEEEDEELTKELVGVIEKLCITFDKFVRLTEIVVHEETKEEFKESVQDALIKFCDRKVEECFPEKDIVNYHRLQQLEALNESMKRMYLISDRDVSEAVAEAKESCSKEFNEAKMMAESQMKRRIAAEKMLESVQAENLLLKKVQNLPVSDQKQLMESFRGASAEVINESFDREAQRLAQRRASTVQTAKVSDIICESRLAKLRAIRAKKLEESERRRRAEEDLKLKRIEESAETMEKKALDSRMGAYASMCETLKRNGL